MSVRIGIDTGGTFTDLIGIDEATDQLVIAKTPSTPRRPAQAVMNAIRGCGVPGEAISALSIGTTVQAPVVSTYSQDVLDTRLYVLGLMLIGPAVVGGIIIARVGHLADRFGRQPPLIAGLAVASICYFALSQTTNPIVAVHLVGGIIGSVVLGLFADAAVNEAGKDGVFYGGGWGLFGEQVLAVVVVGLFSFIVSGLIGLAIKAASPKGIRVSEEVEDEGLDINLHSEVGYALERV